MSLPLRPALARSARLFVTTALAALLVAVAALVPAATASAADLPGSVTSVTTDKTSYGYNERIKLAFTWAVPDSAVAGDTFSLDLPEELKAVSLATFPLLAADGSIVAWGTWEGKSIHVELTDYADTHDGVGGSGFVTVQWDHTFTPETSQPIVLQFGGTAIEVVIGDKPTPTAPCTQDCPPPKDPDTSRGLSKSGWWTDGAYEGTRDATGNIAWSVRLPGSPTGYVGPITVTDTPAGGSIVECATISVTTQQTLAGNAVKSPVDPARYDVTCAPEGFTLVLDDIAAAEFVTVDYRGTITDKISGAYGNSVRIDIPGQPAGVKETVIRRTAAGGDGAGTQKVSVGDFVWLDVDRDGIQDAGEAGIPGVVLRLTGPAGAVTGVNGTPVGPTTTDADGRYRFEGLPVLAAGQYYTVSIDQAASAVALEDLLPTTAGAGADRAADSSTATANSGALTTNGASDLTLDFGFVGFQLPTLPVPDPVVPAGTGELAYTGAQPVWPLGVLAAILVALGGGLVVLRRVRRA